MNVVYLPGFLGSTLGFDEYPGGPHHGVWLDLYNLLTADLRFLQLAGDGSSPGLLAEGRVVYPRDIFRPFYGPLADAMRWWGWNVLAVPWDWRKSVLTEAARVWPIVKAWAAGQPIYIVAHSQGGLLARAVYGEMQKVGADGELVRIVTLCTPHFGTLEAARLLNHMPAIYKAIEVAVGWPALVDGLAGPAYLDAVIASWPSVYEINAFAGAGPLYATSPTQAASLYQAGTYSAGNSLFSQAWANAAVYDQVVIGGYVPPGKLVSIAGTGFDTASGLSGNAPLNTREGWIYTQKGDGLVTVDQAYLPNAGFLQVSTDHGLAVLDPRIWAVLRQVVVEGLTASAAA